MCATGIPDTASSRRRPEGNAAPIVAAGGGLLVEDAQLSPAWIRDTVIPLLRDPAMVAAMSQAAAALGRRDADLALADEVMAVVRGGR